MKNCRYLACLFIALLLAASLGSASLWASEQTDLKGLYQNFKQGEIRHKELKGIRDKARDQIRNSMQGRAKEQAMENLTKWYQNESRKLVAEYRQPFIEAAIDSTNSRLPKDQRINKSLGSDIYAKDPKTGEVLRGENGKPKLNNKHRGWDGDIDLGGDPKAAAELRKTFESFNIKTSARPGYRDFKSLEVTINVGGRLDNVGSSAHHDQVSVDARSKETYVSETMRKNPDGSWAQPGSKAVAVQDHTKKTIKGLQKSPGELMWAENEDVLQGLAKGTLKSSSTAGLSDHELEKVLSRAGYDSSPAEFRKQLNMLKKGHIPEGARLSEENIAAFQKACQETLNSAADKTSQLAQQELAETDRLAQELETRAKSPDIDQAEAKRLQDQARTLREDIADSKLKLAETRTANTQKLAGNPAGTNPDFEYDAKGQYRGDKKALVEYQGDSPQTKKPKTPGKGIGVGTLLDMKGLYDDTMEGVNQALDEEKESDSGWLTWGKATVYGLWNSTNIPAMWDATTGKIKQGFREVTKKYDEEAKKNGGEVSVLKVAEISMTQSTKTVGGFLWDLGKGMVEGLYDLPASAGKFIEKVTREQDPEAQEDLALVAENRLIQMRMSQQRETMARTKQWADQLSQDLAAVLARPQQNPANEKESEPTQANVEGKDQQQPITKEAAVQKNDKLRIRASRVLAGDQAGSYSITVPESFVPPFSVRIDGGGLSVQKSANPLRGRIRGRASASDSSHTLSFLVRDANGNTARGTSTIRIKGLSQKTLASRNRPQQTLYAAPPPRQQAPQAQPTVEEEVDYAAQIRGIMNTYNEQTKKLREQQTADERARKQKYQAAISELSKPSTPSWAQPQSGQQAQPVQPAQTRRSFRIDASSCQRSFESCMQQCPSGGGNISRIKACHEACGNADRACKQSKCPGGSISGVGWDITCTTYQ
jgi:hypothetical protein